MLNHGIHGVQDMCNRLLRHDKRFVICAGHMEHSDVVDRVAEAARAAMIATALKRTRVGTVGEPFVGMGDFQIPEEELKRDLGIEVVHYDFAEGERRISQVTQAQINKEYLRDCRAL